MMGKMKKLFALLALNILSLPYVLMAQDEGTYIDNLNVQDSSYMDQDLLADAEQSSGSNTVLIIVIAVIVVAVVAFLILRKRKK